MRYVKCAIEIALCLVSTAAFGQVQGVYVANYQLVSQLPAAAPNLQVNYRASVVNTGGAVPPLTATVTSLDPFSIRIFPGQGTLTFAAVPANGEIVSSNTVSFLINNNAPIDLSKLQWTFETVSAPVANAGPNQTVALGRSVTLNGSASTNPSGAGILTYSWSFTSIPIGSNAILGHSTTPFANFIADVPGAYTIQLTVSNGAASSTSSVTVNTLRSPPVANVSPNVTVAIGAKVILNGSGSTSTDGLPLSYAWMLVVKPNGSSAALSGANTVSPSFVVDKAGVYQVQLIVNDGLASKPATVTITTQVTAPIANAGAVQVVGVGTLVQLNGAGSTDSNGLSLTFAWTLLTSPAGSIAKLNNPKAVNPTFTVDRAGDYVAQLIVNNGNLASAPATVAITTQSLLAPVANAGRNFSVPIGGQVILTGSGTDPQNLSLSYRWSLISKPPGSAATLSNSTISDPTFGADKTGTYVAQLIVSDGLLSSTPATVMISTACSQPVANPGANQDVPVGQTVTLDGSGSADVCRDPLTYSWSLIARPTGSEVALAGVTAATTTLVPDVAGVYVAQLIVNNGFVNSSAVTVTINASNNPGGATILMPVNVTVAPLQSVAFPVTLSAPAPPGSLFVTLTSSDTSKATVTPTAMIIPQGATTSNVVPMVNGLNPGSAIITASIFGLTPASQVVHVVSGSANAMSFSPGSMMINGTSTQNLTLVLPVPAPPGGLSVHLASSNPLVATAPPTVSVGADATSVLVPVTGVSAGLATITASAASYTNATANVSVFSTQSVSITWYGACWENATIFGVNGNFQAIDFSMITPAPTTFQGTLFFAPNCDPSGGADNLNDFGSLTGTTHMIQGFTHHPDQIPSSAVYWIGPRTVDGMCAPGSPCSGCVNYTKATPNCSALP